MSAPTTLAEAWAEREADKPRIPVPPHIQARRDFYAGALAAAAIPPHQVIAECIDFAKTIGTAVERAR
jgi:hypothetical protein